MSIWFQDPDTVNIPFAGIKEKNKNWKKGDPIEHQWIIVSLPFRRDYILAILFLFEKSDVKSNPFREKWISHLKEILKNDLRK